MASPRTRRLRNLMLTLALLLFGLWLAGTALWQLGRTAVYVHEAVVVSGTVIDVRQKPFESWSETLGQGNWSMPGDVSYQPIVRFTLPGGINAIRLDLETDNEDYQAGDTVSIISPPGQPGKARINRWKFLWGPGCLRLAAGSLLTLLGYTLLRRNKGAHPQEAATKRKSAAKSPAKQAEDAPAKPARRRKSASATTSTPRRRKKAASTAVEGEAVATPKQPRRSRKKKAELQQQELPL